MFCFLNAKIKIRGLGFIMIVPYFLGDWDWQRCHWTTCEPATVPLKWSWKKNKETSQSNTSTLEIMTVGMKNKSESLFPSWLTFWILLNVLLCITCLKTMFHPSTFTSFSVMWLYESFKSVVNNALYIWVKIKTYNYIYSVCFFPQFVCNNAVRFVLFCVKSPVWTQLCYTGCIDV